MRGTFHLLCTIFQFFLFKARWRFPLWQIRKHGCTMKLFPAVDGWKDQTKISLLVKATDLCHPHNKTALNSIFCYSEIKMSTSFWMYYMRPLSYSGNWTWNVSRKKLSNSKNAKMFPDYKCIQCHWEGIVVAQLN